MNHKIYNVHLSGKYKIYNESIYLQNTNFESHLSAHYKN